MTLPSVIPSDPVGEMKFSEGESEVRTSRVVDLKLVPPPAPAAVEPPPPTAWGQLIDALEGAVRLARSTRDRENELLERAEAAEKEVVRHQNDAGHWKGRYEALDKKIPWWARKLLGL